MGGRRDEAGCGTMAADSDLRAALAELDRLAGRVAGLEHAVVVRDQQLRVRAATIRRLRAHRYSPRKIRNRKLARRIVLVMHPVRLIRAVRRRLDRQQGRRASDRALRSGSWRS